MLNISRDDILNNSIQQLKYEKDIYKQHLRISFIGEDGYDTGGLLKDWITNVNEEILKTGLFKPVPSKNYLTIDKNNATKDLLFFTGQLIAIAFNNGLNLNIRLTLFIWKLFKNEKITFEDMKEFDPSIHRSLKWILDNVIDDLDLFFVDKNDKPLIENGRNIKLTNKNKEKYVKLMLKRMFLGHNTNLFEFMVNGFQSAVNKYDLELYNAHQLREIINGKGYIDVNDWKDNTVYDSYYEDYVNMFFDIISCWSQENLGKLLKFVTGSSLVPINGFYYLSSKFEIEICNDEKMFPEAHTCMNKLVLPNHNDEYELERKLEMAIEFVDFAFE